MKSLIILSACIASVVSRTGGCGKKPPIGPGIKEHQNITFHDPATGNTYHRRYQVNIPPEYDDNTTVPLAIYFHGWSRWNPPYEPWVNITQSHGFIGVDPVGMADFDNRPNPEQWVSWNVGDANNTATCSKKTQGYCYDSCEQLNKCSRCNCFTCVDDIQFVRELVQRLKDDFCIDEDRIYVTGQSNGGMFTYYLASQIPELFKGYSLLYAQPMSGWLNTSSVAADSYIISLHGRNDRSLPPAGGLDGPQEWIYESLKDTFYVFGLVQQCDLSSWEPVETPYDKVEGNKNLACFEFTRVCKGRVMQCMYDGAHSVIPHYYPYLTWWFWSSRHLSKEQLNAQHPVLEPEGYVEQLRDPRSSGFSIANELDFIQ